MDQQVKLQSLTQQLRALFPALSEEQALDLLLRHDLSVQGAIDEHLTHQPKPKQVQSPPKPVIQPVTVPKPVPTQTDQSLIDFDELFGLSKPASSSSSKPTNKSSSKPSNNTTQTDLLGAFGGLDIFSTNTTAPTAANNGFPSSNNNNNNEANNHSSKRSIKSSPSIAPNLFPSINIMNPNNPPSIPQLDLFSGKLSDSSASLFYNWVSDKKMIAVLWLLVLLLLPLLFPRDTISIHRSIIIQLSTQIN